MCSPTASSIVSQAARVGAITMTRPVGGSAPTNAAWSGGRYWSLTSRMRGARGEIRARAGGPLGLLPIVAELLEEGELLLFSPVGLLNVIVTEDHATVRRPVAHPRGAVGRRRLLLGPHPANPDPAHPRRRTVGLRHVVTPLLGMRDAGQADRAGEREERGGKLHQDLQRRADIRTSTVYKAG